MRIFYDWLFEIKAICIKKDKKDIVYRKNQRISVFSKTHNLWCNDGVIDACYDTGIEVSYGNELSFGILGRKGSTKFIQIDKITKYIRPRQEKPKC